MRLSTVLSLTLLAAAAALVPAGAQEPRPVVPDIEGLKITGSIPGKARRFRTGDRVPLEVVIHNPTKTVASVSYPGGWWFCGPSVYVTRDGKPVEVRHTELFGSVPIMIRKVQPGATVRIKHAGLNLGKPDADKSRAEPYLVDPQPGKYVIRLEFEAQPVGSVGASRIALDPPLEIEVTER